MIGIAVVDSTAVAADTAVGGGLVVGGCGSVDLGGQLYSVNLVVSPGYLIEDAVLIFGGQKEGKGDTGGSMHQERSWNIKNARLTGCP